MIIIRARQVIQVVDTEPGVILDKDQNPQATEEKLLMQLNVKSNETITIDDLNELKDNWENMYDVEVTIEEETRKRAPLPDIKTSEHILDKLGRGDHG